MESQDQLKALLQKYRQGVCTEDEIKLLYQWLQELDKVFVAAPPLVTPEEAQLTGQRIWDAVKPAPVLRPRYQLLRSWPARAAIAIGILLSVWALFRTVNGTNASRHNSVAAAWDTLRTREGQFLTLRLRDGSHVYLSGGTQLRYPADFGQHTRHIELLQGEAHFDVALDATLPFTVAAKGITTRVLGTRFTVAAWDATPEITVSVAEGRILVSDQQHLLQVLGKGEGFLYDRNQHLVTNHLETPAGFDPARKRFLLQHCSFHELSIRIRNLFWL